MKVSPLEIHGSNKTIRGNPTKFNGFYQVWEKVHHLVYPHERGEMTRCLVVDPITNFEIAKERSWVLTNTRNDDILVCLINNVGIHFKCWEALPFHVFLVP
jgi:hypothetical protein